MNAIPLLHTVSSLITFVFFVGALIFAIAQPRDPSSAKKLAILSLGTLAFLRIADFAVYVAIFQWWSNDVALYHGLYTIASTFVYVFALGLLVAAVFSRRGQAWPDEKIADDRYPVPSQNPYSTPVN